MSPSPQEQRNDRILNGTFTTPDIISYIKDCPILPTGKNSGFYQVPKSRIESFEKVIRSRPGAACQFEITHCRNHDCIKCKEWLDKRDDSIKAKITGNLLNELEKIVKKCKIDHWEFREGYKQSRGPTIEDHFTIFWKGGGAGPSTRFEYLVLRLLESLRAKQPPERGP